MPLSHTRTRRYVKALEAQREHEAKIMKDVCCYSVRYAVYTVYTSCCASILNWFPVLPPCTGSWMEGGRERLPHAMDATGTYLVVMDQA